MRVLVLQISDIYLSSLIKQMLANTGKGYIHLLRPSPELWTFSLPHRTQILYMADIAFVMEGLGVRVGGRVVEAGQFFVGSFLV